MDMQIPKVKTQQRHPRIYLITRGNQDKCLQSISIEVTCTQTVQSDSRELEDTQRLTIKDLFLSQEREEDIPNDKEKDVIGGSMV